MKKICSLMVGLCLLWSCSKPHSVSSDAENQSLFPCAEWDTAIPMHTPGIELFDGVIHPTAGLFEYYFNADSAADEHRHYVHLLEQLIKGYGAAHCMTQVLQRKLGANKVPARWEREESWYPYDENSNKADLFYIVSTNVLSSMDAEGKEQYNALLSADERDVLSKEMDYVVRKMGDSLNVYAPYYRQFTMNSILLPREQFAPVFAVAQEEVLEAFKYYIEHLNQDRPFVLAGFSQGAMIIPELLRRMDDATYQRCKGAYMLGYRLTKEDMQDSRIEVAHGARDGKVISFNSVTDSKKQWEFVSGDAATCINPLNWTSDGTVATLLYQQDTIQIQQDTISHLLICKVDESRYILPGTEKWFKHGCLHHWDLLFYADAIHQNMLDRIYR